MARATPAKVGVRVNLGVLDLSGEWEPNNAERDAAWELYVELITRISVVPLGPDEGLLREALSSLYSVFTTTREIMRKYGPEVAETKPGGQYNFAFLAVTILHTGIRPLLARWHPELQDWEGRRPAQVSITGHEHAWPLAPTLRAELDNTRRALIDFAAALATACGVPNLLDTIPALPPPSSTNAEPRSTGPTAASTGPESHA
jgi:hypothetical protein